MLKIKHERQFDVVSLNLCQIDTYLFKYMTFCIYFIGHSWYVL
jgi:hypothetical protein